MAHKRLKLRKGHVSISTCIILTEGVLWSEQKIINILSHTLQSLVRTLYYSLVRFTKMGFNMINAYDSLILLQKTL